MIDSERFVALTQRYLDGTLDDADARELLAGIEESVELREQLRTQASLHAVLARRYRRRSGSVNRRVRAALRDPAEKKGAITRIMEKLAEKRTGSASTGSIHLMPDLKANTRRWRRHFFLVAAAVVVLALLVPAVFYYLEESRWALPGNTAAVAVAIPDAGVASVTRGGKVLRLKKTRPLIAGDVVTTAETDAVALEYPDKTRVKIPAGSKLELQPAVLQGEAGIAIDLAQGEIDAEVAPQMKDKPMIVLTPHGRAVIIGTHFKLDASVAQSKLEVAEGSVRFTSALTSESVFVGAGQTSVLAPGMALDTAPSTRDPALWPFSAQSPWNASMGSGAKFTTVDSPRFDMSKGVELIVDKYAIPIYIASPNDPERMIYRTGRASAKPLRMPRDAKPETSEFKYMNVIDERHVRVVELVNVNFANDGTIQLGNDSYFNTLQDMGVFKDNKQHGSRVYGGSSMGGIIRKDELSGGIRHAIGVGVPMPALNRNAPSGHPYVWPACYALAESEQKYGKDGNLHLGTLLAIPPDVDIRKIGVGTSGPAFEVARALQDYGAYIVDHSEAEDSERDLQFIFEPSAKSDFPRKGFDSQLGLVAKYLKVVTNNSPEHAGGGGLPRKQPAPPFAVNFGEKVESGGQF